ncbi:hypothetical protein RYX36_006693 [Vicia faba]
MISPGSHTRKRFRTKFTQDQKEKMLKFAEKVGWKMQKKDEDYIHEFCNEICVDRSVLKKLRKLWMFQEDLFGIDIIVFVDQEHFVVDVKTLMLGVFATYLIAKNLVVAVNPFVVASVQADCEPAKLIVIVKPVAGTAATEMAATLTHCVAIVVALKPLVVATCVQNDSLFGCLGCQNQFQIVVVVSLAMKSLKNDRGLKEFTWIRGIVSG